jgi:hypothetical protein
MGSDVYLLVAYPNPTCVGHWGPFGRTDRLSQLPVRCNNVTIFNVLLTLKILTLIKINTVIKRKNHGQKY